MRSAIVQVAVVQMYHSVTYECCHGCQISVLRLSLHQCELALKEALSKLEQQMNSTRVLEACRAEQEEELSTLRKEQARISANLAMLGPLVGQADGAGAFMHSRLDAMQTQMNHERSTNANRNHELSQALAALQKHAIDTAHVQRRLSSGSPFTDEVRFSDGGFASVKGGAAGAGDGALQATVQRVRNLAEINEIGIEKLGEQVEDLERRTGAQGGTVDTLDGRMRHVEAATSEALSQIRQIAAKVLGDVEMLQDGVAETHASAVMREVSVQQEIAKHTRDMTASVGVLKRRVDNVGQKADGQSVENFNILRHELDKVSARVEDMAAKVHAVDIMQVRVVAVATELEFLKNIEKSRQRNEQVLHS